MALEVLFNSLLRSYAHDLLTFHSCGIQRIRNSSAISRSIYYGEKSTVGTRMEVGAREKQATVAREKADPSTLLDPNSRRCVQWRAFGIT